MLQSCQPASRSGMLILLAAILTAACGGASSTADDVTVYKIQNRWNQFIYDAGAKVGYAKTGDDAKHRWVLEETPAGQCIKNLATGAYLAAAKDAREAKLIQPAATGALDNTSLWIMDVVSGDWLSIKSPANGKYLNCEPQDGFVHCDGTNVPTSQTWWLSQWEFVHVGGPKPPKRYRLHEIAVTGPEYCSDIAGDTTVTLVAPGFQRVAVKCWKQGDRFGLGSDSNVATVDLDSKGNGSFIFPANAYPHGPVTVRISAEKGAAKDNSYLQLYNKGGVRWNKGLPRDPSAAEGMTLVLADDFTGPFTVSSTGSQGTYYDHKPPGGQQDFSTLRFTSFDQPNNPFRQVDSYLRIRASEKAKSSGLISSLKNDASGITAKAPCYFECRFIGPNAIGTWPAFWLMTDYMTDYIQGKGLKMPCDELDIIEAYGGEGPGHPNAFDTYMICPHAWNQGDAGKTIEKKAFEAMHNPIRMRKFGIPSTWFETFHTYGCKITETDTIYYCDNIEVGRHPTLPLSKHKPIFFLINLATGGGWPVDLSRYNGVADMYVDYVRVYQGKK
ncbi:MAG: family 16 glycosylhydrolase [Planctomycetes bacterium]|nr:family 16 glycosylhydrolase [Planctomycetota bacterium]